MHPYFALYNKNHYTTKNGKIKHFKKAKWPLYITEK